MKKNSKNKISCYFSLIYDCLITIKKNIEGVWGYSFLCQQKAAIPPFRQGTAKGSLQKCFPSVTADFILCSIFSLMMLMYYPLGMARAAAFKNPLKNWSALEGFTWEIIGFFALSLVALKADKLFTFLKKNIPVAIGSIIYICILILQQIFIFPSIYNLGGGITYLALISAGYLYAKEWKQLLLVLLWIFFVFSLLMNLHDFVFKNSAGLTGNWNWSSTLTLISSGSIFFLFCKKLPFFERKWGLYFTSFTLLILVYLYFVGHFPKGTIFSGIIALGLLFWCYLDYFMSRRMRFILLAAVLVAGSGICLWQKNLLGTLLKDDVRIYLWENGLRVIAENPLIGCEYGRYITVSADKMSPEYFLTNHAAVIHNHPHNEILSLFANFGIGGLVIVIIMLYTFVKAIRNFERRKNYFNGYFLFVYTVLLLHSMVDVLLLHWPNNIIFYLLAGGLAVMLNDEVVENSSKASIYSYAAAGIFAVIGFYLVFMNFMSSMYYRQGLSSGKDYKKRLLVTEKSIYYRPTYKNINDAAVLSNSPEIAIALFESMPYHTGIKNYAHSNLNLANYYMEINNVGAALSYYEKEYQCFPLSVRNLFYFQRALLKIGKKDEAITLRKRILEILKAKKLKPHHANILINYPEYDLNSSRIPAKLLNNQPKKQL